MKRPKINDKRSRVNPFKKNIVSISKWLNFLGMFYTISLLIGKLPLAIFSIKYSPLLNELISRNLINNTFSFLKRASSKLLTSYAYTFSQKV